MGLKRTDEFWQDAVRMALTWPAGALVCQNGIYLHPLEGPKASLHVAFERFSQDDRQHRGKGLLCGKVQGHLFENWTMPHDSAKPLIWKEEIANAVFDCAEPAKAGCELMPPLRALTQTRSTTIKSSTA